MHLYNVKSDTENNFVQLLEENYSEFSDANDFDRKMSMTVSVAVENFLQTATLLNNIAYATNIDALKKTQLAFASDGKLVTIFLYGDNQLKVFRAISRAVRRFSATLR